MTTPRLRIFAGPNGSGKSTLKNVIDESLLGIYVNPDEIENSIRSNGFLNLSDYGISLRAETVQNGYREFSPVGPAGLEALLQDGFRIDGSTIYFPKLPTYSYVAAATAKLIRVALLGTRTTFTFETVMSNSDKVAFMQTALSMGFRVYLYYIATRDPEINVSRVKNRTILGGHDVPVDKITQRYYRSLDLLSDAIRQSSRAYIFDNSAANTEKVWLAETTEGTTLTLKSEQVPAWFTTYVLDKFERE